MGTLLKYKNYMSHNFGTNISYKSESFLDGRQGQAKTKADLLNWRTPVPHGYEVCLDGVWYYYEPEEERPETGHWFPRVVDNLDELANKKRGVSAAVVKGISDDVIVLQKQTKLLDNALYPVVLTNLIAEPAFTDAQVLEDTGAATFARISNLISSRSYDPKYDINDDGILDNSDINLWTSVFNNCKNAISYSTPGTGSEYWLEVGSWILPKITWSTRKTGQGNWDDKIASSEVSGPTRGLVEGLSWMSYEGLTNNGLATYTYNITSYVDEDISASGSVKFVFGYKIYTGAESEEWGNSTYITQNSLRNFNSFFTSSGKMPAQVFNCSGGKYPYILIPTTYYSTSYKTYVADNLNSDFTVTDVSLVNNRNIRIPYKMLRTGYIQTGSSIKIEIK